MQPTLWTKGCGTSRGKATVSAPEAEKTRVSHPSRPHPLPPNGTFRKTTHKKKRAASRCFQQSEPVRPEVGRLLSTRESGGLRQLQVEKVENENLAKLSHGVVRGVRRCSNQNQICPHPCRSPGKPGLATVTPRALRRGSFLNYWSHLTHRQMVICIIYSRPRTLIGHTFSDARTKDSPKFE